MARVSLVESVLVYNTIFASSIHVGDTWHIRPRSTVFALQRERPEFNGTEGDLSKYNIYSRPFPKVQVHETVKVETENVSPWIQVDQVKVISISTASVLLIGSCKNIDARARVKHVRQYLHEPT